MHTLQVSADEIMFSEANQDLDQVDLLLSGQASAQLSINEEGDLPLWQCAYCYEESSEDTPEREGCSSDDDTEACPWFIADHSECQPCDTTGEINMHRWESIPLTWINSASIHADPGHDSVVVTISVGDPRGAFAMEAHRMDDGTLRLSVPYAGMPMPHAPLTELSRGFYRVGYVAPEPEAPPATPTGWSRVRAVAARDWRLCVDMVFRSVGAVAIGYQLTKWIYEAVS